MELLHSRALSLDFFEKYVVINSLALKGLDVYDLSVGSGYIIKLFHEQGAKVHLFDLFPENNKFCFAECKPINLGGILPIGDEVADIIICSETIEHLSDQVLFFKEVSRILRKGGLLILTTPNPSSLRSRFAQFVGESEHYNIPLPNEHNAFTFWENSSVDNGGYFSKLFISGILRLRTLAALQNLKIEEIVKTKSSSTSILLLLFYPIIYYFSRKTLRKQMKEMPQYKSTYQEIFKINTSLRVLLNNHLILKFIKK